VTIRYYFAILRIQKKLQIVNKSPSIQAKNEEKAKRKKMNANKIANESKYRYSNR